MGLALLALIWVITFVSTYFFVAKTWWLPHGASTSAAWIDHQFTLTCHRDGRYFRGGAGGPGLRGLEVSRPSRGRTRWITPTATPSWSCCGPL